MPVLDAPGNNPPDGNNGKYTCQMAISWPIRPGFFGQASPLSFPDTSAGGIALIKQFAATWAEPFRSLAHSIPDDTDVKFLELYDWPPPKGLRTAGHVALVGDALHPMAMCTFGPPPKSTSIPQRNDPLTPAPEIQIAAKAPTTPSSTSSTSPSSSCPTSSPPPPLTRQRRPHPSARPSTNTKTAPSAAPAPRCSPRARPPSTPTIGHASPTRARCSAAVP